MMETQNFSLMDLGRLMHEIIGTFKKQFDNQADGEIKISVEQFSLLHAITQKDVDVIQKDMAEKMGKDKSAILRLIDSLEEKGLVRRVAALEDRRKNYLMVTKLGNRVLENYMKIVHRVMDEIQEGLTTEEIETFQKVVRHLRNKAANLQL
jgi:MarR family transcriptional regulator for hemolysin